MVYSWGANDLGQLGDGTKTSKSSPGSVIMSGVMSGKFIKQISAGDLYNLALASDGTLFGWGWNFHGQLCNVQDNYTSPIAFNMTNFQGKTITQVYGGDAHGIALTSDQSVFTWGSNSGGQIGDGKANDDDVFSPYLVIVSGTINPSPPSPAPQPSPLSISVSGNRMFIVILKQLFNSIP